MLLQNLFCRNFNFLYTPLYYFSYNTKFSGDYGISLQQSLKLMQILRILNEEHIV